MRRPQLSVWIEDGRALRVDLDARGRASLVGKRRKQRLTVYGTRWCGQSASACRFLDTNNVRYQYVDIDENAKGAEKVMAAADGNRSVPTLAFPDGRILVEPSRNEMRDALGLEKPEGRWWWPF